MTTREWDKEMEKLSKKIKNKKDLKKLTKDQKAKLLAIIQPIQSSISDMILINEGRGE
jgi:hypothetical protein